MNRNMEALNAFVDKAEQVSDIRLEFKSPIHVRITIDGKWIDFWPTTSKWYDPVRSAKGDSVETLINILNMKTGIDNRSKYCGQLVPANQKPSISERIAIIEEHLLAIRAELSVPATIQSTLPSFMDQISDEKPYDDSWAKGDPFEKDEPPWND